MKRRKKLLTCETCHFKFDSSVEFKKHTHLRNQPSESLTCSWCDLKTSSYVELNEHEHGHCTFDDNSHRTIEFDTYIPLDLRSSGAKQRQEITIDDGGDQTLID